MDIVEHRIPEEERICEECGTVMQEIGKEVRRTLQIIPAQVRIREDWYYTYACQKCKLVAENTPVVKAKKNPAVIPGSFASPEAIAQIMTQKFVMGSPLYRQEQELERMGVHLSRQTMSGWILRAAQDWLKPVYECLHRELVQRQVLHADETTLQVLHEPGKSAHTDSYMWLYRTSGDTDKHIVLYEYQPNRKADHPKEFLKDFPDTCIRMDTRDTMSCREKSGLWAAGRTRAGTLTKRSKYCRQRSEMPRRPTRAGRTAISCLP